MSMNDSIVQLHTEDATTALGCKLARLVAAGDVIALWGDLGAGKSTLARALLRELTGDETLEAPSPTFTLVLTYDTPTLPVWHYDLYRLEAPDELYELGFDETELGLALIEWPEKMGAALPEWRLDIQLEIASSGRIAHLYPRGPIWSERLDDFKV